MVEDEEEEIVVPPPQRKPRLITFEDFEDYQHMPPQLRDRHGWVGETENLSEHGNVE